MKQNVYGIYDEKALAYSTPFFSPTDGLAMRSFGDLVSDDRTTVGAHPADFTLYKLGVVDLITGEIVSETKPVYILRAVDFIDMSVVD